MKQVERLLMRTVISFSVFMIVIGILGSLFGEEEELSTISTLFAQPGSITYRTMFQGLLVGFLISLLNVVMEASQCFKGMLLKWKLLIKLIGSTILVVICILIFDWFPIDDLSAWIGFILSFGLSMGIAVSLMLYKTKKENEEYQALFENYKQQHPREEE